MKLTVKAFLFFLSVFPLAASAQQKIADTFSGTNTRIAEESFVSINGIEQWVTIKGESSKPAILFVHGGPGSPISPYADVLYKDLEKDFIIVQWDQRGTGKTYGRNAPPAELTPDYLQSHPLTLDQMTDDGIALSAYLIKHLDKKKIILFGTSWGSALAVKMATKKPGLYYAYVGHSQIVNPAAGMKPLYDKVYTIATNKKDSAALATLNTISKPPYDRAKATGQLFRIVKKYERDNSTPAPEWWFTEGSAYGDEKDKQNRADGDDYSFVNYTGDKQLGVQSMSAGINLFKDNAAFKIPVYLIQGSEDILTPKDITREYFNIIKAPSKKYFLLQKTAHGFNENVLQAQFKIFRSIQIK